MAGKSLVRDSGDAGMIPLFNFTNAFIDGVFPQTIGDFIEENDIIELAGFGDLTFKEYIVPLLGVAICVAVGVLFIVFLPLCGCCYCLCRTCCGCCQPHRKQRPQPPSSCKKWTCCSILFVLVSCMAAAVTCSFLAVAMVNKEFTKDGFLNDLVVGLDHVETYLHDSMDDIDKAVFPPLNQTTVEVFRILDELPETTMDTLAKDTGIDPALYQLNTYTQNLAVLNQNLTVMDSIADTLEQNVSTMDSNLGTVQTNIQPLLDVCVNTIISAKSQCQALLTNVPNLESDAKYDTLDDVTAAITATQAALDSNVPDFVSGFVTNFENIQDIINNTIGQDVKDIKTTVTEIEAELKSEFDEIDANVKNISVDGIQKQIQEVQPHVEKYGSMGSQVLYLISSLLLIFVILYLIGIPMGAFGGPQRARHGSNCLMAAVAFTFIFGALFMLLTMILFVVGSAAQGGLCRHLTTYDESMQSLEQLIRAEIGGSPPYNLTGRELLDNCAQDQALYTAFRLDDNGFNISDMLDLDNTQLPSYIDQLKNVTVDIGTIEIINDQVNDSVLAIEGITNEINFEGYLAEVEKAITLVDVPQYSSDVRAAADIIEPLDSNLADDLKSQADELDTIYNNNISPMEPLREDLTVASTTAKDITESVSLAQVMGDLTTAQNTLNNQANRMIQGIIGNAADSIYKELKRLFDGFITSIEEDIAGCLPAYEALTTVIYGPCVYFLYPYNAVWFTYGWYLAFGLIAIFFATSVVGMFRIKALGRKVENLNNIPMSQLDIGYHPSNKVSPYGSQVSVSKNNMMLNEPPPDYLSTTHGEQMHGAKPKL